MRAINLFAVCVVAALVQGMITASAAEPVDIGKRDYDASCAVCHGLKGKGDGVYKELLQGITMPDLTTLAKRNGGVFPAVRVYEIIDGRTELKAHGPRDMPIWGRHFVYRATPTYDDFEWDSEASARAHILMLMDYLYRLQEK
jgi:mono/diheme cytochrome c family protein